MDKQWTVERRINLGDLLSMVAMFSGMLVFVGSGWLYLHQRIDTTDRDVAVTKVEITHIKDEMSKDRAEVKDAIVDLKNEVRRMTDKMEQKADKTR